MECFILRSHCSKCPCLLCGSSVSAALLSSLSAVGYLRTKQVVKFSPVREKPNGRKLIPLLHPIEGNCFPSRRNSTYEFFYRTLTCFLALFPDCIYLFYTLLNTYTAFSFRRFVIASIVVSSDRRLYDASQTHRQRRSPFQRRLPTGRHCLEAGRFPQTRSDPPRGH